MTTSTPPTTSGSGGVLGSVTGAVSGVMGGVASDIRNPLRTVASVWGPIHSIAAGVITAGATLGVLNSKSSGFLNKGLSGADIVMAGITGVLAGVAPLTAVAQVVKQGEQLVTPVADPRDNSGNSLS
jgi:hypothetical protein